MRVVAFILIVSVVFLIACAEKDMIGDSSQIDEETVNVSATAYNPDMSCSTDDDCIAKKTGCNCCGYTYSCVNKEAEEYLCEQEMFPCTCINEQPKSCGCNDGKCQNIE